jgi:predicted TIM-barrel fold metal-dependent hydrolase
MEISFEIIDAHIHPFIHTESNTKWFDYPTNHEEFFADLSFAGIAKSCGSVIRPLKNPSFADIQALNREAIELKHLYPDLYIPGINVHGNFPQESCEEIEKLHKEEKICWIGELVAYMMDYENYASENMFQVYALAQDLEISMNIHPYALDEIEKICENFPKLKVVIAHPSAGSETIKERFAFVKKYPNAYLDLSGSGVFRYGMLAYGIKTAGKHKFLFGTDYPICNPHMMIEGILFERLTDEEFEAVFSGNFKRLTGIQ